MKWLCGTCLNWCLAVKAYLLGCDVLCGFGVLQFRYVASCFSVFCSLLLLPVTINFSAVLCYYSIIMSGSVCYKWSDEPMLVNLQIIYEILKKHIKWPNSYFSKKFRKKQLFD